MKSKKSNPFLIFACIASLAAMQSASAIAYYWDSDGDTAGYGNAAGTWGTSAFWTSVAGGGATHTGVTALTTADVANFGSSTLNYANATVGVAAGGVTATSIVFGSAQTTGLTIGTVGGGDITLGGSIRTIVVNSTGHAINAPITLTNNTTISFSRNTAAAGSFALNGGIGGTGNVTFTTPNVNSGGNVQTINLGAAGTWSGSTTMTTGNGNNSTTIRNTSGAANVLPITTVLTLSGGTGVGSGRTVTFDLNGRNQELAGLQNTTAADRDQRVTSATAATLTINNSAAYTFGNNTTGADPGDAQITGAIALTKKGTGTFTLAAGVGHSYSGLTTIDGGALRIQNGGSLGNTAAGTVVNGATTGSAGNARLELDGGITVVAGEALIINGAGTNLGALTSTSGENIWAGAVTIGSALTRLGASTGATLTVSGVIDSGLIDTGLNIRTNDLTATVILSGANTYLGNTNLLVGKLQLGGGDNRLPLATNLILGATTNITEFDLNGRNQEVAGISLNGTATAENNSVNNSSGTLSTLTVNTAVAFPSSFGGVLKGNLALTKTGADTLTLTGSSNTYTGATTINGGMLALDATGTIDTTSGVVLGGGTFDVSAKTGGYTVNNLSGNGTVVGGLTVSTQLAIGTSPGTISFGSLSLEATATFTYEMDGGTDLADLGMVSNALSLGGATLSLVQLGTYTVDDKFTLFGYDGDLTGTFAGLADGDLTTDNLGGTWQINYDDDSAGRNGGTGASFVTITAIPEPSASLLGLLGALIALRRRRA